MIPINSHLYLPLYFNHFLPPNLLGEKGNSFFFFFYIIAISAYTNSDAICIQLGLIQDQVKAEDSL